MHTNTCICKHVQTHIHVCVGKMCVCVYIYMYIYIVYTCIHNYIYARSCICFWMHRYTCVIFVEKLVRHAFSLKVSRLAQGFGSEASQASTRSRPRTEFLQQVENPLSTSRHHPPVFVFVFGARVNSRRDVGIHFGRTLGFLVAWQS